MNSKNAMLAMALLLSAAIAFAPMVGTSAIYTGEDEEYEEGTLHILSDSDIVPSADENPHSYLYDFFLVAIIVLVFAGALHVKARGLDFMPKKE